MLQNRNVKLVPSAARTAASGQSGDQLNKSGRGAIITVKVNSAPGGTSPTLTVKVQGKTASGDYYDLPDAVTEPLDEAGITAIVVPQLPRNYRVKWDLGGTSPSFTFSVDASLTV